MQKIVFRISMEMGDYQKHNKQERSYKKEDYSDLFCEKSEIDIMS